MLRLVSYIQKTVVSFVLLCVFYSKGGNPHVRHGCYLNTFFNLPLIFSKD